VALPDTEIAVVTNQYVDYATAEWLAWMAARGKGAISVRITNSYAHGTAWGRDEAVKAFGKGKAAWLWFVDSDVVPPRSVKFLERPDKPAKAGPCKVFRKGAAFWNVYKGLPDGGYAPFLEKEWPRSRYFHADAAGTGCMLLHRSILEASEDGGHWFGPDPVGSDLRFCKKIGGVAVDTHFPCSHYRDIDISRL